MKKVEKKSTVTVDERMQRIENLDLEPVMVKLMDQKDGKGWTIDQVLAGEKWYKRYLKLNLLYPGKSIVPSGQIDDFWHYHILDTMKYQTDCDHVYGYFLHHFPYFGLRGEEDAASLEQTYNETLSLFNKEFGESIESLYQMFSLEASCHSGCDTGPGSCHVSCIGACHASPIAIMDDDTSLIATQIKKKPNTTRPTLASYFKSTNN